MNIKPPDMKSFIYYTLIAALFVSCKNKEAVTDAYGNFTATEVVISAESSGKIILKNHNEGDIIDKDNVVFVIDTIQSYLKKNELVARKQAIKAKRINVQAQINVLEEQKRALEIDIERFGRMIDEGAVSQKQIDDLENKRTLLEKQIEQVRTNFIAIDAEAKAIEASLRQVDDVLARSKVRSPGEGTILETYAEKGESVAPGKPLFKIADLKTMELKAYFSGNQLASIKIGDTVEVLTDGGNGELESHKGKIVWIASDAEFTPKIIQTREERINLVYAVKISVPNDGSIKINMPAEVRILN
jgi:HlyD family secretion protein